MQKTRRKVSQVTMQVVVIEEKLRQLKDHVGNFSETKDCEYKTGENLLEVPYFNKAVNGQKSQFENTASRGIMKNSEFKQLMPDFKQHQDDYFLPNMQQDSEFSMLIDSQEKLGCCKPNYFCF